MYSNVEQKIPSNKSLITSLNTSLNKEYNNVVEALFIGLPFNTSLPIISPMNVIWVMII